MARYINLINFNLPKSRKINIYKIRFLRLATTLTIYVTIGILLTFLGLFIWYSRDLPSPDRVKRREGFSTVILDRNKKPLYDIYTDKNRKPVTLSEAPDILKKATVAVEDKDFYKHQGFDPKGILRAIFHIISFRGIEGGSTLTQQLVKNVLLSSERTLPRKIKEFILSVQIEKKYTKDEILQMYLNEAPYGGTMWGIESASQGYFGKKTKDLNLIESVILAGLPQRPTYYSPFGPNPKAYKDRAEEVLRRIREDGYITQVQEYEAKRELDKMTFLASSQQFRAAHFIEYIKRELMDRFKDKIVEGRGYQVETTLDGELQEKVEEIVGQELDKLKNLKVSNCAAIVINPQNGEILAYVGSRDFNSDDPEFQGKFDVVSQGYRQPGSALKPITYAVAFSKGYTPATLLMDVETHFPAGAGRPDYIPKNYDGKFRGPVQIRFALGNSINVPAVKITALVGIKDVLKTAYDMGLTTLKPTDENIKRLGLSLTLGGGEVRLMDLTAAYGVFATGGIRHEIYAINKITDTTGSTIFENKNTEGKRVLNEDVSFLISHILLDNNARKEIFGERSYLNIPSKTVSVKTGTTDDKRDNWTIGYTPSITVGVWVGNNDNSPMDAKLASGVTGAAPIWNRIIREALLSKGDEQFKVPDNIISTTIDAFLGDGLPYLDKSTRSEYFIKGTEPKSSSINYQKLKLSKKDSSKLANIVEIATGNYDEKEFYVFKENDPISSDGKNRWQEGINNWLTKQSDQLYHPPQETSSTDENTVVVRIKNPQDKTQIDSDNINIIADSKAIADIKKMELFIDDQQKDSVNNNTIEVSLTLSVGIHKIKVKAYDGKGNSGEKEILIGVKVPAELPTVTPTPSITPTLSLTPIS